MPQKDRDIKPNRRLPWYEGKTKAEVNRGLNVSQFELRIEWDRFFYESLAIQTLATCYSKPKTQINLDNEK